MNSSSSPSPLPLVLAPPTDADLRAQVDAALRQTTLRGVPADRTQALINAHVRPFAQRGYRARAVLDLMRRGINFAVPNCVPSMRDGLRLIFNQFVDLAAAASLQNARSQMALSLSMTMMNAGASEEQLNKFAYDVLTMFAGVMFDDRAIVQLKTAIQTLAGQCVQAGGSDAFARQEDTVRADLIAYQAALYECEQQQTLVSMLEGQVAFLERPNVRTEVYKSRITQLGKALQDLQLAKTAVPPNEDSVTTRSSGWFIFSSRSTRTVKINNDQQRNMYQAQMDQVHREIQELGDVANASDAERLAKCEQKQTRLAEARGHLARWNAEVANSRVRYETSNAKLQALIETMEVTNRATLECIAALAQGLTDAVLPIADLASNIRTHGEALRLARDNLHLAAFFTTIVEFAVMGAAFDGADLLMLEDERFGRGLQSFYVIENSRNEAVGKLPQPKRAPDF